MNILITGVCGYIGKYLSSFFNNNQHKVFGIDLIESPSAELIKNLEKYICVDLSKNKPSKEIFKNIDVIIHLAGEASLKSKNNKLVRNNIDATQNLMNSLDASVKKLFFLSSIKATDKNEYAKSKLAAEQIIINGAKEKEYNIYDFKKCSGLRNWNEK